MHCTTVQVQLARLISTVPHHMDPQAYLTNIVSQLLSVFMFALQSSDLVLQKTLVLIAARCCQRHGATIDELLFVPVAAPVLRVSMSTLIVPNIYTEGEDPSLIVPGNILVNRRRLTRCLEAIHSLVLLSPPLSCLAQALSRCGVMVSLMELFHAFAQAKETPTKAQSSSQVVLLKAILHRLSSVERTVFLEALSDWYSNQQNNCENDAKVVVNQDFTAEVVKQSGPLLPAALEGGLFVSEKDPSSDKHIKEQWHLSKAYSVCRLLLDLSSEEQLKNAPNSGGKDGRVVDQISSKLFVDTLQGYFNCNKSSRMGGSGDESLPVLSDKEVRGILLTVMLQHIPAESLLSDGKSSRSSFTRLFLFIQQL